MANITEATANRWVQTARAAYSSQVISPFCAAYQQAYTNFTKTLEAQDAADKAEAEAKTEMAILALSLIGGFGLGTVMGAACAKACAGKISQKMLNGPVLDYVSANLGERSFKTLDFVANDIRSEFVAGALFDVVSAKAGDKLKAALTNQPQDIKHAKGFIDEPLTVLVNMTGYVDGLCHTALLLIEEIFNGKLKDKEQEYLKKFHQSSKLLKLSHKMPDKLKERIELSFWMRYLLTLDQIKVQEWRWNRTAFGSFAEEYTVTKGIPQNPTDKNYPKTGRDHRRHRQEVIYNDAGELVKKRIDTLYKALVGHTFFGMEATYGGFSSSKETVDKQLLMRAQFALKKLQPAYAPGSKGR
ncbi:hypothetical protein [Labrenzia sp. PHM005]|uniref:hypothetical protein n=1 Tax=Labrenzia sp. PHM005 TaxID=2590016 RepID=UPI0011401249|nr:hypothetical protein [Labrenzia sp. PHM005]QDG77454.1 hypothetical protein FJ695_17135 [Labrenzia sp. PHM005]